MGCAASMPRHEAEVHAITTRAPDDEVPLLQEVDVTQRGIDFSYLLDLVESRVLDRDWTIQEVVEMYVRPTTSATKCCLFDVVPASCKGKPKYFISHTWSRTLGSLLDLLQQHFQASMSSTEHIWLDIVAINQHPYEDKGCLLNEDVTNLGKVLRATEQTLFCLDKECVSLGRIWCLYEVWQTFLTKGAAGLMVLMPEVAVMKLTEVFNTFDVNKAQATQDTDKVSILARIDGSIGATEVNLQLKAALVDSAVHHAMHAAVAGLDKATLFNRAAQMLYANGRYAEAESMFQHLLETRKHVLGADHVDTITAMKDLATCVIRQGRYSEAEPMLRQAMEAAMLVFGADHLATLAAINNLALCSYAQGHHAEAELMFRRAFEAYTRVLGADDPHTMTSANNLALSINDQGRHAEAELVSKKAHEARTRVLGADHPQTIGSFVNVALCIDGQGRHTEAEPMYRRALEAFTRVLGPDHPSTINTVYGVALCMNKQGRHVEAEPVFRQALEARTRLLGPDHPTTLDVLSNLAICINAQGRRSEAVPMLQQAFQAMTRVLGAEHPETIVAGKNLDSLTTV